MAACTPEDSAEKEEPVLEGKIENATDAYLSAVDVDYAYEFTKSLGEFKTNEKLGYRTAGSEAEIKTGEKIGQEMERIGLEEVTKDEFTLDTWTFEKADLTFTDENGEEHLAVLGGYQVNFDTGGEKEFDIIYGGKATAEDLEGLDIEGKLVLIDINQREEWWINYPAYQAHLKGAAGVIAVQEAGYGEVDPDALNTQDVCGPDDAPAFSMSQTDGNKLKAALEKSENGTMTVTFDAKSTVEMNGTSYNYYGKIIGKDPESYIILSAHYDSYFEGFQDDNAAIGMLMGVAKGLIDSGYQPEKTIIFNALAAEEWGVSNSRYDWSTGAYNQIFNIHPEWVGKAFANMNFEMPAYEHTTQDEIRTVYELNKFITDFTKSVPKVEGVYEDGVSVVSPLRTWSDDFSFSIAGVPALRNDFQDSDFSRTHYHSQFDNEDVYNEKAFKFHLYQYGMLTMHYDRTAVVPLDFTARLDAMKEKIDKEAFEIADVPTDTLVAEIDKAIQAAETVNKHVKEMNHDYLAALQEEDYAAAKKLYNESRKLNSGLLEAFKHSEDQFTRLTWEDGNIFPHEHAQGNILNLQASIDGLEEGDIATPLDEHLWLIDNNWYAYDFEKEVFDYFTDYVLEASPDKLTWGEGRIVGHVDLYDLIHSLKDKRDIENADVTEEITQLQKVLEDQKSLLKSTVDKQVAGIAELTRLLERHQ